jgi:hypothetical protein
MMIDVGKISIGRKRRTGIVLLQLRQKNSYRIRSLRINFVVTFRSVTWLFLQAKISQDSKPTDRYRYIVEPLYTYSCQAHKLFFLFYLFIWF